MTKAQYDLIVKLAGSLDAAAAACEAAGFEMAKNCGKNARIADMLTIGNADASDIIAALGGPKLGERKSAPRGVDTDHEGGTWGDSPDNQEQF